MYIAGFECATGYNRHRQPMDQVRATQHDRFVDADYALLKQHGIDTVRDAVRWNVVDKGDHYDFSSLDPVIDAANKNGMTVIWDLFHYGFPDDVNLLKPEFVQRFARYCGAAAAYIASRMTGPLYFTPVNEPSFMAWAGGDAALFAPHLTGRGPDLKIALAMAAIAGADAIFAACPNAQIVQADPVCHVVPPKDRPDLQPEADRFNNEVVFETMDIIAGKKYPTLGGSPRHLGIVGINYYWNGQWELGGGTLAEDDPRRVPLRDLIRRAWERYGQPVMVSETAHQDDACPGWIRQTAVEARAVLDEGIPLQGICLYPVLGIPEWHEPEKWLRMGLWDLVPDACGVLQRVPHQPSLDALKDAQALIAPQPATT